MLIVVIVVVIVVIGYSLIGGYMIVYSGIR